MPLNPRRVCAERSTDGWKLWQAATDPFQSPRGFSEIFPPNLGTFLRVSMSPARHRATRKDGLGKKWKTADPDA